MTRFSINRITVYLLVALFGAAIWATPVFAQQSERIGNKVSMMGDVTIEEDQIVGDVLVFSGDVTVRGQVEGDIMVLSGSVRVEPSGRVEHRIAAIGGDITVKGRVLGNVSVIGGNLVVDPEGLVRGNADVFAGTMTGEIGGNLNENTDFYFPVRPMISGARAALFLMLLAVVVHLCWALIFPGATARLAGILDQSPGPVIGVGILMMLALPAVLALAVICLTLSFVGIPLAILLIISPFFLFTLGWTGLTCWLGRKILRLARSESERPLVAVLVGTVVIHLPLLLPLPGLNAVLFLIGLILVHGMMTLTRLGVRHDWDLPVYCAPRSTVRPAAPDQGPAPTA